MSSVYPRDGEFLALEEIHAAALAHLTQELHILMTLSGTPDIPSLTSAAVARRG